MLYIAELKLQVMKDGWDQRKTVMGAKAPMKTLMAVLILGGVMSAAPVHVTWAGSFDGALFSVQYQGGPPSHDKRQPLHDAHNLRPGPQQPGQPQRGQLTPDERRQLHRDLDKANRELYSGNRRKAVPAD